MDRPLIQAACDTNGVHVDRRPLIAQVAPGPQALVDPSLFLDWLIDAPITAVYVQPLRLHPTRDGLEKLARYTRFLLALKAAGLSVIAGRVGAFGLVLCAMGVNGFDSGLGDAEAFELSRLNRPPPRPPVAKNDRKGSGGRDRRIYFEALKTTLPSKHAYEILGMLGLRSRFTCTLGCCALSGFESLPERRRTHYLWVRHNEIAEIRRPPTLETCVHLIHDQLLTAREHAAVVRRALGSRGLIQPDFGHLDRWIGVLAREAGVAAAA